MESTVEQRSRRITIGCLIAIGALVALFVVFTTTVGVYTDWLWFASLGQLSTYQTRLWTEVGLWLVGGLLTAAFLVVNWFVVPRHLLGHIRLYLHGRRRLRMTIGSRVLTIILGVVAAIVLSLIHI